MKEMYCWIKFTNVREESFDICCRVKLNKKVKLEWMHLNFKNHIIFSILLKIFNLIISNYDILMSVMCEELVIKEFKNVCFFNIF
jgi:hypothetical protein